MLVNADFLEALSPAAAQPAAEKTGVRTVPVVAAVGAAIAASAETTDATGKLSTSCLVSFLEGHLIATSTVGTDEAQLCKEFLVHPNTFTEYAVSLLSAVSSVRLSPLGVNWT